MSGNVRDYFAGKKIFITGGSGFVGKGLIEKLLRSCPDVETIYLLSRKKKGKDPMERLKLMWEISLFDKVRKEHPNFLKKLVPINGDVREINLGMSEEDRTLIKNNVNIFYHVAASVRFDDHLTDAIIMNVRGTREACLLALEIHNLHSFVHVSTSYCNTDKKVVDEIIYPAHTDWKNTIKLAEEGNRVILEALTTKFINPLPNTYTFTKSLAEHVVKDLCKGKIPAVIFRPSVVTSSLEEPFTGWVDNFNGPIGLLIAGGKGILRTCYGNPNSKLDYIPVDIVIKMMVLAAFSRAVNNDVNDLPVYHSCSAETSTSTSTASVIEMGKDLVWDAPSTNLLWYPAFKMTNNFLVYYFKFLIYHMIPAVIVDALLLTIGKKPILVKVQRKIYVANTSLSYYMKNSWKFINKEAINLQSITNEEDFKYRQINGVSEEFIYNYFSASKKQAMKILFKEDYNKETGLRNTYIMWILNYLLRLTIFGIFYWFLATKIDFTNVIYQKLDRIGEYWEDL